MPVEIRELVIKTNIVSRSDDRPDTDRVVNVATLRRDLLEECERMLRTAAQARGRSER